MFFFFVVKYVFFFLMNFLKTNSKQAQTVKN